MIFKIKSLLIVLGVRNINIKIEKYTLIPNLLDKILKYLQFLIFWENGE